MSIMQVKSDLVRKAIHAVKKKTIYECPVCYNTEELKADMNRHIRGHEPETIAFALGIEIDEVIDDDEMIVYSV